MNLPTDLYKGEYLTNRELPWLHAHLISRADENGITEIKQRSFAKEIGISYQSLRTFLGKLESMHLITQSATQQVTRITICQSQTKRKRLTQSATQQVTQSLTHIESHLFPEAEPTFESKYPFVDSMMIPAFKEWLEYKKERKETYKTERTAKAAYKKLMELSKGDPQVAMAIVEQSEAHQWASMYELKTNYNVNRTNQTANQPSGRGQYASPSLDELAEAVYRRTNAGADY